MKVAGGVFIQHQETDRPGAPGCKQCWRATTTALFRALVQDSKQDSERHESSFPVPTQMAFVMYSYTDRYQNLAIDEIFTHTNPLLHTRQTTHSSRSKRASAPIFHPLSQLITQHPNSVNPTIRIHPPYSHYPSLPEPLCRFLKYENVPAHDPNLDTKIILLPPRAGPVYSSQFIPQFPGDLHHHSDEVSFSGVTGDYLEDVAFDPGPGFRKFHQRLSLALRVVVSVWWEHRGRLGAGGRWYRRRDWTRWWGHVGRDGGQVGIAGVVEWRSLP